MENSNKNDVTYLDFLKDPKSAKNVWLLRILPDESKIIKCNILGASKNNKIILIYDNDDDDFCLVGIDMVIAYPPTISFMQEEFKFFDDFKITIDDLKDPNKRLTNICFFNNVPWFDKDKFVNQLKIKGLSNARSDVEKEIKDLEEDIKNRKMVADLYSGLIADINKELNE